MKSSSTRVERDVARDAGGATPPATSSQAVPRPSRSSFREKGGVPWKRVF